MEDRRRSANVTAAVGGCYVRLPSSPPTAAHILHVILPGESPGNP